MKVRITYRKYAEALYDALREDAFYIAMEESVDKRESAKEAMLKYMEFSMMEGEKYGALYVPGGHDYGVSVWAKPISRELEAKKNHEKKMFLRHDMGEKSLNTYKAIVEFMSVKAEPFIDTHFWYLSIVGILPEFQGQGFGPGLITKILKTTDALQAPTYLETFTPRNMPFYERLGYHKARSFYEPTTRHDYCLMVREPVKQDRGSS